MFLPMRFYSGSDTLREPLKEKAMAESPLPELEGLNAFEEAFFFPKDEETEAPSAPVCEE